MTMKKIYLLSFLLSFGLFAQAQSLIIDNFTMNASEETTINICVHAEDNNYVAAGLMLQLADGFSLANDASGHWASADSNIVEDHVTKAFPSGNNRLKIAIYSPSNNFLNLTDTGTSPIAGEGQSGESSGGRQAPRRRTPGETEEPIGKNFCSVQVVAPNIPGVYNCQLTNIEYSTADYGLVTVPDVSFQITVQKLGDLNSDGAVNVSDVTTLVGIILNNSEYTEAADVNGDKSINVSDVTALVGIILSGN